MSKLEKKWWFAGPVAGISAVLAILLMQGAGLWMPQGAAQWLVYLLCFVGIQRSVALVGWLLFLIAAPRHDALS